MRWTEIPAPPPKPARPAGDAPGRPAPAAHPRAGAAERPITRGADSVDDYRTRLQLAAARRAWRPGSRERGLWTLPEPWTRRHAPTAPWKTTERFSTAPTGIILSEGTFLFR